jgi:F-type H+-transporting ATPase subunit alpha
MQHTRDSLDTTLSIQEIGTVISVSNGIAVVNGLANASFEELLIFSNDSYGIVFNLDVEKIGVVLLGNYWDIRAGSEVRQTGRVMDIGVGNELIGRVINPLGDPLDEKPLIKLGQRVPIEQAAPSIMARLPVTEPLQTGIKVIDTLLPIGRGQRELIVGDRQTGKTSIAIDTIINQKDKNVLCIYCTIGQRAASVAKTLAILSHHEAMQYTIVVVSEGNDSPGLNYICPYAATSVAEYFMQEGRAVLIVYDDLTQHARSYRELSLLLRRTPGREAFPGDIFYIHSRLLERATHLNKDHGGGSLTALPIIETEEQNISAYIPTNLISITDGQIYLSPTLFDLGILPAVDVGKSVSRVGGKAQLKGFRQVAGDLKLIYAQFEELESFTRFGAQPNENSLKTIERGKRIRAFLQQHVASPLSVESQIITLLALTNGLFDSIPLLDFKSAELALVKTANDLSSDLRMRINSADKLSDDDKKDIFSFAKEALKLFHGSKFEELSNLAKTNNGDEIPENE